MSPPRWIFIGPLFAIFCTAHLKTQCLAEESRNSSDVRKSAPLSQKRDDPSETARQHFQRTKKAAEAGDLKSQYQLGSLYALGKGVKKDDSQALLWYRKAAERNHPGGQSMLGVFYTNARGVPRDYAEAIKWFRQAAAQNSAHAQYNLGHMYANGKGVPRDDAESARWYRLAAEQNDVGSQRILGSLYATGRGVPKDLVQAYTWMKIAAAGEKSAQPLLDDLKKQLKPEEVTAAEKLAGEIQARIRKNR